MERQFTGRYGKDLPPGSFVNLVGAYNHISRGALHFTPNDEDHLHLWISPPGNNLCYRCAVHTRLTYEHKMQICSFKELIEPERWPDFGVQVERQALSYRELGLRQADFRSVGRPSLNDEGMALTARADRIQVFGTVLPTGDGIHDIHQNSGETEHVVRPNRDRQDGALIFYFAERPGIAAHCIWWCIKFERQSL